MDKLTTLSVMVVLRHTELLTAVIAIPLKLDALADSIVFLRGKIRTRGCDEVIRLLLSLNKVKPRKEESYGNIPPCPHLDLEDGRGSIAQGLILNRETDNRPGRKENGLNMMLSAQGRSHYKSELCTERLNR